MMTLDQTFGTTEEIYFKINATIYEKVGTNSKPLEMVFVSNHRNDKFLSEKCQSIE